MAAGELQEQLGDFKGAQNSYLEALKAAEGPGRTEAMARLASVVEGSGNANTIVSTLGPLADSAPPELNARLGLAQLALGQREEAEQTLQRAMSADAAGGDARARAEYGQAEVLLAVLQNYPQVSNLDQLEEFIALIEVVEESYLNAAQQATPAFAAASLARLAHASNLSAGRLRRLSLPGNELSADEKTQIQEAMKARAENLDNTAKQALEACANQAWQGRLFTPIVRQCLAGKSFKGGLIPTDRLQPRSPKQPPQGIDDLRQRLSKNPEDVEGLRELGIRFLDAGDPHVARLIFARAIQAGGGATEHNLLGIASAKAGDLSGAFEAFSQAASSGLEAGRQNLLKIMSEQGLNSAAAEVNKRYPEGEAGGRLL
ncbi:MAG: hypothetical protein AAFX99_07780 [Myxococcota bacterium]